MIGLDGITGDQLNERWKIGAEQVRYSATGKFYRLLDRFPAALCDRNGFVRFENRRDYELCKSLAIGRRINVKDGGIASMVARYKPVPKALRVR
jgi:hypothetical protein